ncbi:hypothetical protein PAXRUDRAFT_829412 [Paxillus rubicundulus Ve08.2h10]|uniref:Uncharacterized protein n=1 Tax=Paxillus rubicundulus Ve08.2h10 TaxID=930991 RepID=A0A0D0DUW3_9AGAM|nr:hypothetical protein PAXRUDRAFT_829412 [Paxillus rubicundulus Ve08.2h10]
MYRHLMIKICFSSRTSGTSKLWSLRRQSPRPTWRVALKAGKTEVEEHHVGGRKHRGY